MPSSQNESLPNGTAEDNTRTRIILIGIGGATCSGKTTLAKHLRNILPNSLIIHQDDFAPLQETLPIHPELGVQDWDSAPTATDWPRFRRFLATVKRTGVIPTDHSSHDHLNKQVEIPVPDRTFKRLQEHILDMQQIIEKRDNVRIVWGIVDGFLLYWDQDVIDLLDVKIFMRVPSGVLAKRRSERSGYATAEQLTAKEGTFWRDPPGYWEKVAFPAYEEANRHLFENGDYEHGKLQLNRLVLLEPLQMSMSDVVECSCGVIHDTLESQV